MSVFSSHSISSFSLFVSIWILFCDFSVKIFLWLRKRIIMNCQNRLFTISNEFQFFSLCLFPYSSLHVRNSKMLWKNSKMKGWLLLWAKQLFGYVKQRKHIYRYIITLHIISVYFIWTLFNIRLFVNSLHFTIANAVEQKYAFSFWLIFFLFF